MEEKQLFRKNVMDRLSSPEELNDYLHVTKPSVWIALIAVVVILVGAVIWSSVTYIDSYVSGTAEVKDGIMTIVIARDTPFVDRLTTGQEAMVGDTVSVITGIGFREGNTVATAPTTLSDGAYEVKVKFRSTQLIGMIFN